jgi:hypothetical protein
VLAVQPAGDLVEGTDARRDAVGANVAGEALERLIHGFGRRPIRLTRRQRARQHALALAHQQLGQRNRLLAEVDDSAADALA